MKRKLCFVLLVCLVASNIWAQFAGYEVKDKNVCDSIADEHIASVVFSRIGKQNTPPIIALRGDERLVLTFDYLGEQPISPVYKIYHCTPDWEYTELFVSDYMVGFEENQFAPPAQSRGTVQQYLHYELPLPNTDVQFRISGNYIIEVRDAFRNGLLLFQRRFALLEEKVVLHLEQREVAGVRRLSHQHLWAHVDIQAIARMFDTRDLRVFVQQGWNNGHGQELPMYNWENSTSLLYGGQDVAQFSAGDQWHVLDLQTLRTASEGVRNIVFQNGEYHVEVLPDKFSIPGRVRDHATTRSDLNGWCVVGYTTDKPFVQKEKYFPLECEYAWAYFTLEGIEGSDVVLELGPQRYKMFYNKERGAYETSVYLKQGVYSYRYLEKGVNIEGVSSETHNEYWGLAYYCQRGERYWRLIGVANNIE